ncbi:MAG: thioredoxin family protein [Desulfarculaceae bacterium]|nr:thioredoxin family protein [Desulfarculaceae bacterium]MCF8046241.1 thioredoxin family protein [Desulfarculaceae bacterium]MCF8063642.1 thioredoxin family protein [Desulfarculaceae bacterium]MCF8098586.1 thioredoxin family protein [Desulfarculaceae bacterium]MCF8120976.1 thioredoxin family protein [Desulfarculaceae bacterium]
MVLALALSLALLAAAPGPASATEELPVKGMVTLVDLGADKCIPCRMMAPILDELKIEYKGKAAIVFLDVWKDRSLAAQYGIRAIPTQVFYDKQGREAFRHEGFLSKENIELVLTKLGVEKPKAPAK